LEAVSLRTIKDEPKEVTSAGTVTDKKAGVTANNSKRKLW